ncbi:MAG: Na+/H+ antiporter NhaA [Sandaracinobacteroides sp.]
MSDQSPASAAKAPLVPSEAVPGIVLLVTAIAAMWIVNSPFAPFHADLLTSPISIGFKTATISMPVVEWVKNLLMAVFFFYAGLELKREVMEGALSTPAKALLPLMAALGGVILPALIYIAVAAPAGFGQGWAIPAATDIAFALGLLALLGSRVPAALKAFLLAVAVVDDLVAILIVAVFFSGGLDLQWLLWVVVWFVPMLVLNQLRIPHVGVYMLLAVPLWLSMQNSGINPTIAGVLAALAIPMRSSSGESVLVHVEHGIKPYVLYGVMPVFALASAGAVLDGDIGAALLHPVTIGILLGLLVGKPAGIVAMTYLGSLLLKAERPGPFPQLLGVGFMAGIGFTMSLFIGKLAFKQPGLETMIKLGVYGGSILSAGIGLTILALVLRPRSKAEVAAEEDETDYFIGDDLHDQRTLVREPRD